MIKLDEAQHQHAREAEMLRMLKEKHQKEREDELMREAAERKEMKKYDNFYNITSKILGGGEMSLQKRLSKPLHLNQPVVEEEPRKRKPRVVQEVMNRSRKNEAGPSQSKGIGRELSSERSNSADPELMNRRAKGATEASDEIGGSSADINHPDATSSSVSKAGVEDDSSLRLSYNSATERHLDAPPEASEAVETPAQIFQAKKMEKLLAAVSFICSLPYFVFYYIIALRCCLYVIHYYRKKHWKTRKRKSKPGFSRTRASGLKGASQRRRRPRRSGNRLCSIWKKSEPERRTPI